MHRILLHIVLLTYTSLMFKPVLPFVADVVAHTLFYKSHMSTVHFENGKFHVHKEIVEQGKKAEQNDQHNQLKKETQDAVHLKTTITAIYNPLAASEAYPCSNISRCPTVFYSIVVPPPRSLT